MPMAVPQLEPTDSFPAKLHEAQRDCSCTSHRHQEKWEQRAVPGLAGFLITPVN